VRNLLHTDDTDGSGREIVGVHEMVPTSAYQNRPVSITTKNSNIYRRASDFLGLEHAHGLAWDTKINP